MTILISDLITMMMPITIKEYERSLAGFFNPTNHQTNKISIDKILTDGILQAIY